MIGETGDLHMLRSLLEAGCEYQTMGHTLRCKRAFPPRWEGDNGRDSRAQLACNVWNRQSMSAADELLDALAADWEKLTVWGNSCQLRNKKTEEVVEARSSSPAQAVLAAVLKGLIADREKDEGVTCVSCKAPAVRTCDVDCGDAACNSPLCATCRHEEKPYIWRHKAAQG